MKLMIAAIAGALVSSAGSVQAQSYRNVAANNVEVFFVQDPIVERREVLAYVNVLEVREPGEVAYLTRSVRVDCLGNEFALSRQAAYSENGTVLQRADDETDMVFAPPNSPMGKVIGFACWQETPEGSTLYQNLTDAVAAGRRVLAAH